MNAQDRKRALELSRSVAKLGVRPVKKEKKAYNHPSFAYKALGSRPAPWLPKKAEIKKKAVSTVASPYQYDAFKVKDGYSPRKGIDYLTPQEVEEMKAELLNTLRAEMTVPDQEQIVEDLLKTIKDRKLSINDLADTESFIMRTRDGMMTRYKYEELMHGAGSGSGGATYYVPTGTVDASNAVFGVTAQPTSVIADGITYFEGFGYSYAALSITMDIPPSQYIKYTL